jgi:hypothetical protein
MKTIKLRQLIECESYSSGVAGFAKHLGLEGVCDARDLRKLPDEILDADRALVGHVSKNTRYEVLFLIGFLEDWSSVLVEFANGCVDAVNAAAVKDEDSDAYGLCDSFASRTARAAADVAAAADARAAACAASEAAGSAFHAVVSVNSTAVVADAEQTRQVAHLRDLLNRG